MIRRCDRSGPVERPRRRQGVRRTRRASRWTGSGSRRPARAGRASSRPGWSPGWPSCGRRRLSAQRCRGSWPRFDTTARRGGGPASHPEGILGAPRFATRGCARPSARLDSFTCPRSMTLLQGCAQPMPCRARRGAPRVLGSAARHDPIWWPGGCRSHGRWPARVDPAKLTPVSQDQNTFGEAELSARLRSRRRRARARSPAPGLG
jgi:hypothetical protein